MLHFVGHQLMGVDVQLFFSPSLCPSSLFLFFPSSSRYNIFEELGMGLRSFQPHVSSLPLRYIPSSLRAFSKMKSHVKLLFNSST